MAKRTAEHQISKEGGGFDEGSDGDDIDRQPKEMPKANDADLGVRKIRALPARKSANASPAPEAAAPVLSKPAFGSTFTFGSAGSAGAAGSSSPAPNPFAATSLKPSTTPSFSFGASTASSAASPSAASSNLFGSLNLPKPTAIPSASPGSNPFSSFGSPSSPSSFSTPAASTTPASASSNPPPSATPSTLPWSSTGSLPKSDKKASSPSASVIVEPPSTPAIPASSGTSIKSSFNFSSFGSSSTSTAPTKPSPLATSSFSFNPAPTPASTSSSQPTNPSSTSPATPAPTSIDISSNGIDASTASSDPALLSHYLSLRGLNYSLITLLQSLTSSDPFVDLSLTLDHLTKSYVEKRKELGNLGADDEKVKETAEKQAKAREVSTSKPKSPEIFKMPSAPVLKAAVPAPAPTKTPVFPSSTSNSASSSGGFSFGGVKLPVGGAASSTPFATSSFGPSSSSSSPSAARGGFSFAPSTSTAGSKPAASFSFSSSGTSSTDPSKASAGFSFGASSSLPPASFDASSSAPKKPASESASFMKSLIAGNSPSSSPSAPDSEPKAASAATGKPNPFGGFSAPQSKLSSAPTLSFGTSSSPSTTPSLTSAPTPPAFQRLPGGTPNFSFGAAAGSPSSPAGGLKRQVSSSSFSFGSPDPSSTNATPSSSTLAPTPPPSASAPAMPESEEEPPAPTIPSDPTLLLQGQGEENEATLFECKGAISKFDDMEGSGKKGWVKIGVGIVKVKVPKDETEAGEVAMGRLLGRNEGNGGLLMNFALHQDLKPKIQQTKNVVFAGFEKTKGLQFLIRVKDGATAQGLLKALEERLEKAKK